MESHDDLESGDRTNSSTTSATTVMLAFRPRMSATTATGLVHGLSSNATALRGACSIPIVHSGSNNCRGGPGATRCAVSVGDCRTGCRVTKRPGKYSR